MDSWPFWAQVLLYFTVMVGVMSILSLPLAPATLIAAQFAPPWSVALVATCSAAVAAVFDYWFVRRMFRLRALDQMRKRRLFQRAEGWARVAPFWTTALFAGFPVPFTIVRVLVPLSGYQRAKYIGAVALGRFPRIFVIATFGSFVQIPRPILVKVFLVTLAVALVAAVVRYLRGYRLPAADGEHPAAPVARTEPRPESLPPE